MNIELLEHREYSLTRNAVEDIIRLGDTDQKADIYDKYGIIWDSTKVWKWKSILLKQTSKYSKADNDTQQRNADKWLSVWCIRKWRLTM